MGMKRRTCQICTKRKRYDADNWPAEGWGVLAWPHFHQPLKVCPDCIRLGKVELDTTVEPKEVWTKKGCHQVSLWRRKVEIDSDSARGAR